MTIHKLMVRTLAFCLTLALLGNSAALAGEIKVMMSGWFTPAYRDLGPQFEEATGDTLVTVWGPTEGTALNAIPVRLARGEWADVLIVVSYALDDQINAGTVVSGSKVDFARSPIGVAVREGAPKPDISSADALRRTLLAAKSIVYPDSASGVYIGDELFSRLGIEGRVKSKSRMVPDERVATIVANGEAELGLQQVVELLPVKGVTVVGSLPAEVQRYTVFSGGIATTAKNPAGAEALIRFLSSPEAAPAIVRTGLEPLTAVPAN
ncbi:substrate-binding domain-containing protein [Paraburkholderia silviterrae]|uniref:ABC transporter substrate-binding protein n=1 Tax=Paraburkholderia silviterrae TaxID=2528715 RepID=A0A4R5M3S7_9BURK|nr:substrate-binding domain-containing protein [Paraburkholderia silviterrae]TDG19891.1 ABC transporter substrate-binding protein [Paraburkholderia silviterrae]